MIDLQQVPDKAVEAQDRVAVECSELAVVVAVELELAADVAD